MKRLPGWRGRLDQALDDARKPFCWGENDCCVGLAGPAVLALTGEDLAIPFRSQYSTALGALKALKAAGFDDLDAFAASYFPKAHPSRARMGDLAAFKADDTGWALGVVIGAQTTVLRPDGIGIVRTLDADHIFLVG